MNKKYCYYSAVVILIIIVLSLLGTLTFGNPQGNRFNYIFQCYFLEKNIIEIDGNKIINIPKKYTGNWKAWYKSGVIQSEVNYISGLYEGTCRSYFKSGKIKNEYECKKDLLHGPAKHWYKNGQLKWKGNYYNDECNGKLENWNRSGKKIKIEYYDKGKLLKREIISN